MRRAVRFISPNFNGLKLYALFPYYASIKLREGNTINIP
jgi:hypothetical protein